MPLSQSLKTQTGSVETHIKMTTGDRCAGCLLSQHLGGKLSSQTCQNEELWLHPETLLN